MIVLRPREQPISNAPEKKSLIDLSTRAGILDIIGGLENPNSWSQVSPAKAAQFYQENSVIFAAVDIIAQEFARIAPIVRDLESGEIVPDHPILALLKKPNPYDTEDSFLSAWARNFLITGNAFLTANGDVKIAPIQLFARLSGDVNVMASETDGFPLRYEVSSGGASSEVHYDRVNTMQLFTAEEVDRFGLFRFYASRLEGEGVPDLELLHTRNYNPNVSVSNSVGLSKLSSVFYEACQLDQGNVHNLSLLRRGARPTAILSESDDSSFTDDQMEQLKSQINNLYTSAENAGRPLFLPRGLLFKEFSVSNKDMDYLALRTASSNAVYNAFRVPLALMSTESMTLDNFREAKLFLYDNAVIPLADLLYGELTNFLIPRYGEDPFLTRVTIDMETIPALEPRRLNKVKSMKDLGIFTTNELRQELGREDVDGGDVVPETAPAPQTFAASNTGVEGKAKDKTDDDKQPCTPAETYRRLARNVVDADGVALFTEADIAREADKVKPKK